MRIYNLLEDNEYYYIASELCSQGDLNDFIDMRIQNHQVITEDEVRVIIKQLFKVLNYMHSLKPNHIVHRDLKPENILIANTDPMKILVTDFGFSRTFDENEKLNDMLGTPYFIAPEIVDRKKYDTKVDIWSSGVIIYQLLSFDLPFLANSQKDLFNKIS